MNYSADTKLSSHVLLSVDEGTKDQNDTLETWWAMTSHGPIEKSLSCTFTDLTDL